MTNELLDPKKVAADYSAHMDRWLAGQEQFIAPAEFIGQKLAEAVVAKLMAEKGWLAA